MLNRPSRQLWLAAIVVSVICVGGLAWGLIQHWNEPVEQARPAVARETGSSGGFGLGLVIGLCVGVALGSLLALRRRQP